MVSNVNYGSSRGGSSAVSSGSPSGDGARRSTNLGSAERWISLGAGAFLSVIAARRRGISGFLLGSLASGLLYRGATAHCPLYSALGVDRSAGGSSNADSNRYVDHGVHVKHSIVINRPADVLYSYWRNLENLPSIMTQLKSVRDIGGNHSHWVVEAPSILGGSVEWDARIIRDEPNRKIAWESLPGADVSNAGSVSFEPTPDHGSTEVRVVLEYIPPAGGVGQWLAERFGVDPEQQIVRDLQNFKRLMEESGTS